MNKLNRNIEIITGNFFHAWVFAFLFVMLIAAIIAVYQIGAYLFLAVSILLSIITWFSKKFFEFNPDTKEYRNGFYLFGFKLGKWKPLEIERGYIAFQRYDENVHYTYGGLFNKNVEDKVFELRLVYPDLTFKKLVNGRDFRSVAMMVQLGKILSLLYYVEFKDFVKGTVHKDMKRERSNDNPLLLDERKKMPSKLK